MKTELMWKIKCREYRWRTGFCHTRTYLKHPLILSKPTTSCNVHTTPITLKRRCRDVKTTSCAYWDIPLCSQYSLPYFSGSADAKKYKQMKTKTKKKHTFNYIN